MASSRRYVPDSRTTNAVYATPFDPRPVRPSDPYSAVPRSPTLYETKPISRRMYPDDKNSGSAISRTEYAVRPRVDPYTNSDRRPSSIYVDSASSTRGQPIIIPSSRPRSPPYSAREDSNRYLQPATTHGRHHQRHNSATRAETDRLPSSSRLTQYRPETLRPGPPQYSSKIYAVPAPVPRQPPDDDFSYTGPREQFARDYPSAPPPQRRGSYSRRDRPVSIMSPADLTDSRPKTYTRRDMGPPPSASRQLERLDRDIGSGPRKHYDSDSDYGPEGPRRRHSTRVPVVHQQREDGYGSARDDRDGRRLPEYRRERHDDRERPEDRDQLVRTRPRDSERDTIREREDRPDLDRHRGEERSTHHDKSRRRHDHRHEPRSRDSSPETSKLGKGLAALGLGGVVAGLGGKVLKDPKKQEESSDDPQEKSGKLRRRRHKGPEPEDDTRRQDEDSSMPEKASRRRYRDDENPRREAQPTEDVENASSDERRERRRHRRRKHRDDEDSHSEGEAFINGQQLPPASIIPPEQQAQDPTTVEYTRKPRDYHDRVGYEDDGQSLEQRTVLPGENEDDRPRRVQLVEPMKEKEDLRPKSILKQPTPAFPEDPNPTREGAAPLKDLTKDGVPQGARWTKISRRLVNPDALVAANERYEERDDYVVVLRVVPREDVMKLAELTKAIREAREKKWQEEALERRDRGDRDDHHRERNGFENNEVNEDDAEKGPPMAIEQAPPPGPFDPRFAQQQDPLGRTLPPDMPVPAISVQPPVYNNNV